MAHTDNQQREGSKMKQEVKDVAIDADHIVFYICPQPKVGSEPAMKGKSLNKENPKKVLKRLKKAFMDRVDEYVKIAEVESIVHDWTVGKPIICISDKSNFRYDIFPDYKGNRKGRESTENFKLLRKWVQKKFALKQNIEADELTVWHVRRGAIGFSTDKDVLRTEGIWFDAHHLHLRWLYPTKEEAYRFFLLQCVMGDSTDGIVAIPRVGKVKAMALLDKYGWSWRGVVDSYHEHGMSEGDALLTRSLVDMNILDEDKNIKLPNLKRNHKDFKCARCGDMCFVRFDSTLTNVCGGCSRKDGIVYGVGVNDSGTDAVHLQLWRNMMKRSYSESYHEQQPTYKGVTVCDEWLTYSSFESWCMDNYIDGYELDKDLLSEGNKRYDAEHCVFIPKSLNLFLIGDKSSKNTHGVGIVITKSKTFRASITTLSDGEVVLGYFKSAKKARKAYKKAKLIEYKKHISVQTDVRIKNALREKLKLFKGKK